MANSVLYIKKNSRAPKAEAILSFSDGTVQDLTGCTVRFLMRPVGSTTPKVAAAATVEVASDGHVSYTWASGDTDTVGTYEQEWEVTLADGRIAVFPAQGYNYVVIQEDVAT